MGRIDKESYYLDIAETVLERSTCSRSHSGALIVRNDEIVSTGYNGAPRGRSNCIDLGYCIRERLGIPAGERYELCRSVHAEMNAIISAARSECSSRTRRSSSATPGPKHFRSVKIRTVRLACRSFRIVPPSVFRYLSL